MLTSDRVVLLLRVLLVLLFAGLVVGQTLSMPGQFAHMAQEEPDLAYLRWPLTVFASLELACGQVVIVCTWRLLTMVKADRIFSDAAFVWVNAIVAAMTTAWALLLGAACYFIAKADDPGTPILLLGLVLTGGVLVLLMVVMRALLHQATTLQTDMAAVI